MQQHYNQQQYLSIDMSYHMAPSTYAHSNVSYGEQQNHKQDSSYYSAEDDDSAEVAGAGAAMSILKHDDAQDGRRPDHRHHHHHHRHQTEEEEQEERPQHIKCKSTKEKHQSSAYKTYARKEDKDKREHSSKKVGREHPEAVSRAIVAQWLPNLASDEEV
jgi:hypothetical protein